MSEDKKVMDDAAEINSSEEKENKQSGSREEETEVFASKSTGADAVGITDDDIEEMTVDQLARTVERPGKSSEGKSSASKEKKNKSLKKSPFKRFWKKFGAIIIILILIIIGILLFMNKKKKMEEELAIKSASEIEYALIERQDLTDSISTTGTIVSKKTAQVISSFKESTKITNVYYEVGDHVSEGDIIVTYSTENIEKSIANKKEDIAYNQQLAAIEAENTERNYIDSYGKVSYDLQNNNEKVEEALKDLYEACDAYGDAKRELEKLNNDYSNLEESDFQKTYMATKDSIESLRSQRQSQISTAYQNEQKAQKNYSDAVASLAETNRTSTSSLSAADSAKEKNELNARNDAKKLNRELESYEDSLEDYIVYAPISGVVTKVDVEEGNGFTNGNVMTIQRDDIFDITTEIDEYDIPYVKEGQKVIIKTDATQDDKLEGTVISIAPTATSSSSSGSAGSSSSSGATYTVKIEINNRDERLRLGMTAKINIITEERSDILVVRYDAIEEDEDGYYVRVVDNSLSAKSEDENQDSTSDIPVMGIDGKPTGNPEKSGGSKNSAFAGRGGFGNSGQTDTSAYEPPSRKIYVEKGIEGDYYTQIISDEISEGMQVLVTSSFTADDMFGFGGGPPDM